MTPLRLTPVEYASLGLPAPPRARDRRTKRRPPRRDEAALLAAVRRYLTLRGVWFMRVNSALAFIDGRPVRSGTPGAADLLLTVAGRAVWVELKAPCGGQTAAQRAFQAAVERAGASYWLVRSLGELIDGLRSAGLEVG